MTQTTDQTLISPGASVGLVLGKDVGTICNSIFVAKGNKYTYKDVNNDIGNKNWTSITNWGL